MRGSSLVAGGLWVASVATGPTAQDVALEVRDVSAGAGNRLEVSWTPALPTAAELLRAVDGGAFVALGTVPAGLARHVDDAVRPGWRCRYRLVDATGPRAESAEVACVGRWLDRDRLPVGLALCVLAALLFACMARTRRGYRPALRALPGLQAIEEAVGRATEMDRPLLYTPGIGDVRAPGVLASLGILGWVAEVVARHGARLRVPVNNAFNLAIGQQVVRDAYARAGRLEDYRDDIVHFIAARQFDYAAAVCGLMEREQTAAHLFFGSFWSEALILTEAGAATGALQIAATDSEHQLPFFVATCDHVLIGEELYAASACLTGEPGVLATVLGQDLMKLLLLALLLAGAVLVALPDGAQSAVGLLHWLRGGAA